MGAHSGPESPNHGISRRQFFQTTLTGAAAASQLDSTTKADATANHNNRRRDNPVRTFRLDEHSIADLRKLINQGMKITDVTQLYLDRIHAIDKNLPGLRAVIEVNPTAIQDAQRLDRHKGPKRPLFGIPVLVKDNIDTKDMATTAGSRALVGVKPPAKDAFLVDQLRKSGAVILGKANLSEWAAMRSSYSVGGWSAHGGLTKNPYALDRNPAGSSSGSAVAVAANLCAVAVGTETSGSIIFPSSVNGVVGIKPTVGLVSRKGIIPLALSQDTAGPIARSVADAAALLDVMAANDGKDYRVPLKLKAKPWKDRKPTGGYASGLTMLRGKRKPLAGKKIGLVQNFSEIHEDVDGLTENAMKDLEALGAVVKKVELPDNLSTKKQWFGDELTVLYYEFRRDINEYLEGRHSIDRRVPKDLAGLIGFNNKNESTEMRFFGQDIFKTANGKLTAKPKMIKVGKDKVPEYPYIRNKNWTLARNAIDDLAAKGFHALVAPSTGTAGLTDFVSGDSVTSLSTSAAAISGYPSVSIPMGMVHGLPVGLSFFGRAWSESVLIKIAFCYEDRTSHRQKPTFRSTANLHDGA